MLRAQRSSICLLISLSVGVLGACRSKPKEGTSTVSSAAASASAVASAAPVKLVPAARREGSALARTVTSDALYVADEDHDALRRVALPLDASAPVVETKLPGPPGQVLVREGQVWVTVRDPGLLLGFAIEGGGALREIARVTVAPDAWGMGLSPDEKTIVVTSPWTHTVSVVDRASAKVTSTHDVAREPRGAVFTPDGQHVYLTHLVGTALTRLDLPADGPPALTRVALPASPLRAPRSTPPSASLAYAAALSPDGKRLFVPRHALGTYQAIPHASSGWSGLTPVWYGSPTIDVLGVGRDQPIAPARATGGTTVWDNVADVGRMKERPGETFPPPGNGEDLVQPRDVIYRPSNRSLIVVSEGTARICEYDALSPDPSLGTLGCRGTATGDEKFTGTHVHGVAPQGLAMSADESTVWYFARGSYEVGAVSFGDSTTRKPGQDGVLVSVAEDSLGKDASIGRRLFYEASDQTVSGTFRGGLACAGCHPEGRDDGFTWHEVHEKGAKEHVFVGHPSALVEAEDEGMARQTPMLAGRVAAAGPYGWHGQNKDLEARMVEGFRLHRWSPRQERVTQDEQYRINKMAVFLRKGGLRAPPHPAHELTPEEERGKAIFTSEKAQCASCHPAGEGYTTRASVPLRTPLPTRAGFAADDEPYKVPSLLFVGGTAPYYHDGSAPTLEELIEKNGDRMGQTSHLDASEKKALVAFLRTL